MKTLKEIIVSNKIAEPAKMSLSETRYKKGQREYFEVKTGLRQGDRPSIKLFNYLLILDSKYVLLDIYARSYQYVIYVNES